MNRAPRDATSAKVLELIRRTLDNDQRTARAVRLILTTAAAVVLPTAITEIVLVGVLARDVVVLVNGAIVGGAVALWRTKRR